MKDYNLPQTIRWQEICLAAVSAIFSLYFNLYLESCSGILVTTILVSRSQCIARLQQYNYNTTIIQLYTII